MHKPRFLIAIGLLVFVGSLVWMYARDRVDVAEQSAALLQDPVAEPGAGEQPAVDSASALKAADDEASREPSSPPASANQPANTASSRPRPARATPIELESVSPMTRSPDDEQQEVKGELSISGRVISPDGNPVGGIAIVARGQGTGDSLARNVERRARSNPQGGFSIDGLVDGEYELRTVATDQYTTSGGFFRAGLRSADIILTANTSAELHGRVTNTGGMPLAGVEVRPIMTQPVPVWTDSDGRYRTQVSGVQPGNIYTVQFQLDGYVEERASVRYEQLTAPGGAGLDVQLRSDGESVTVTGKVQDSGGTAVPGERVQLASTSLDKRYAANTAQDGTFTMPAVPPGSDYRITIHPDGPYESYYEQNLSVQQPSTRLAITLQPLDTGRVTGHIVDNEGYGVPDFTMSIKSNNSQSSYVDVTSDGNGYFTAENAPAGHLIFATRSQPSISVSGITLEPGGAVNAELVIDWGELELGGRVVDESRTPLSGVDVRLSGQYVGKGIQSNSVRRTVTDSDGYFRFTQLGSGPHRLDVVADGYQGVTQNQDIEAHAGEITVTLERLDGQGD